MFTDKLMSKLQKTHPQISQITGQGRRRRMERRRTGKASEHELALEFSHPNIFMDSQGG